MDRFASADLGVNGVRIARPASLRRSERSGGGDADWIRALVLEHGAWANIPPRRNRNDALCFSPYLYRARNLVERFFNKIKQCRRVATRDDKLAANYLAFIQLASIRLWLRVNESTPFCNGPGEVKSPE